MPKPIKQAKRPRDVNQWARQMVEESTREVESPVVVPVEVVPPSVVPNAVQISAYMAQIGSKGGKVGGKQRLKTMTAEARSKIARKAANARWRKSKT
jgi:hypothetical protein